MLGHNYKVGDFPLNQRRMLLKLSEIGLVQLEDGVYGTIQVLPGPNPFNGIIAKYHKAAIRRFKNNFKFFDSLEEFRSANVTHEIAPRFIFLPPTDKPYVNYLIVKRLVELEGPMDTDEPTEMMEIDETLDNNMEVDDVLDSQEDEELLQSVILTASEHFHTIFHSGISARVNSLIDRLYENAAEFDPLVYGMLRVIQWTTDLAHSFNFESPFQAVLATELFLSTWDDVFAKPQYPGIMYTKANRDAWQKVLDMDPDIFNSYFDFVYNSVSTALFNRDYENCF